MKKLVVVAMFILFVASVHAGAAEMTAQEVVSKSWDLFRLARDEKELVHVAVAYRDGRREEKELTRWTRYEPSGEDKVTIRFSKPALDDGLMLLVWRHPGKNDDVWLKLPSFAQERRISTSDQGKYFAETDLTYEDTRQLIGERVRDFEYRIISKSGGGWTIEATAKPGVETAYGKRVFTIDRQYVFTKIEYYAGQHPGQGRSKGPLEGRPGGTGESPAEKKDNHEDRRSQARSEHISRGLQQEIPDGQETVDGDALPQDPRPTAIANHPGRPARA